VLTDQVGIVAILGEVDKKEEVDMVGMKELILVQQNDILMIGIVVLAVKI